MEKTNKEIIVDDAAVEAITVPETAPAKGKVILDKVKKIGKKVGPIAGAFGLGILTAVLGSKLTAKKGQAPENYDEPCDYGVEDEDFDYPMEDPAEGTEE